MAIDILSSVRWFEPRISFDTQSQQCTAQIAEKLSEFCTINIPLVQSNHKLQMIAQLEEVLGTRARALFHLVRGTGGGVPSNLLERHIAEGANSAAAWSDLSASILLGANGSDEWKALESAIIAAETAIDIDEKYNRAHFNRALVLEKLLLNEAATDAWSEYIELADGDQWSREAAARVLRMESSQPEISTANFVVRVGQLDARSLVQLARQHPSRIRRLLDNESVLLTSIVEDVDSFCKNQAESWQTLGIAFRVEFGDSLLFETMEWLCGSSSMDENAIEGIRLLASAINWRGISESDRALNAVIDAEHYLEATRSPLVDVALVLHASALFSKQRYSSAEKLLQHNLDRITQNYPMLGAKSHKILGSIKIRHAEYETAVQHFSSGIALLSNGGDPEQLVRLKSLMAEAFARAGRYGDAWREGMSALNEARIRKLSSETLSASCEFLAVVGAESGASRLQELYSDCSIYHLSPDDDPTIIASAHVVRAQARISLGNREGADDDLHRAQTAAVSIEDLSKQMHMLRYIDFYTGLNYIANGPAKAIEFLARARGYFEKHENQEFEILAVVGIVDAYTNLGDHENAEEHLDRLGKMVLEAQRSANSTKFSFPIHQHYRPIVNRRIRSKLVAGAGFDGLRALLEARLARNLTVPELKNLVREVGAQNSGEATLILAWLDDEVAGWLIDDTELATWFYTPLPAGREMVERAAGTHTKPLAGGRAGALAQLYDSLITPTAPILNGYETLRIIPDDLLFGIPFAALWNAQTEQYLVEEIALKISPELVFSTSELNENSIIESVAVFADATSDSKRQLTAVDSEAAIIASIFRPSAAVTLFSDEDATSGNFLDALGRYDLLHFAGHGIVDLRDPLKSRLVFAETGVQSKRSITAEDLYAHDTSRMPHLIVLAACDTAAYTDRLPQALALVRPLLDLGAGEVIGSLRPIPDQEYLQMMGLFYKAFIRTGDAAYALRTVQVALAQNTAPGDLGYWAFIQYFSYL